MLNREDKALPSEITATLNPYGPECIAALILHMLGLRKKCERAITEGNADGKIHELFRETNQVLSLFQEAAPWVYRSALPAWWEANSLRREPASSRLRNWQPDPKHADERRQIIAEWRAHNPLPEGAVWRCDSQGHYEFAPCLDGAR